MNEKQLETLLERYHNGEATPEESIAVESWFNSFAAGRPSRGMLADEINLRNRIWGKLGITHKPRQFYPFIKYAAAAMIVLAGLTWLYINDQRPTEPKPLVQTVKDIQPGGNKAILTLANGKEISLNTQSGSVAAIPALGMLVSNNASSGIVTFKTNNSKSGGTNYAIGVTESPSTITTPRGGQYQLVLSDGTRVFLNAASTLTFPTRFAGNKRIVSLIGEAYFEVAKDNKYPFQVNTKDQQLTVLGTHFNVAAYPGETVKTTLAEGRVLLLQPSTGISQPLKPDQQAVLLSKKGFAIQKVDPSQEIAWIDGMFIFNSIPLKDAMRQISRWYDLEVDYDSLPDKKVSATLFRTLTLSEVLKAIEVHGKFKLTEGRRLVFNK